MSAAPDFFAVLQAGANSVRYGIAADQINGQLLAKVPELCPCVRFDGQVPGHMRGSSWAFVPCDHREAPNVDELLAEAAAARIAKGYPLAVQP